MAHLPPPFPILIEPRDDEHAAYLIRLMQQGAWAIRSWAVLGVEVGQELRAWALTWPEPGAIAAIQQLEAAHDYPDVPVKTHWHCLCLTPPYHTALARLQIRWVGLPGAPEIGLWCAAREHVGLLRAIVTHRRVMLTPRAPPPAMLDDPAALAQLPGILVEFDSGLEIVQALLDLLAADTGTPRGR